ncbi:hypothetical protein DDF83_05325 [Mycobacterium tuberculosis]|nr:hypothetical protein DDF83_05325 [Mycobacterium tuberculosis]
MAVPTRRKSRANTRSRRSQWRARPDGCGPNTPGGLVSADYRHRVAGEVGDIDLAGDGVDRHPGRSGADGDGGAGDGVGGGVLPSSCGSRRNPRGRELLR